MPLVTKTAPKKTAPATNGGGEPVSSESTPPPKPLDSGIKIGAARPAATLPPAPPPLGDVEKARVRFANTNETAAKMIGEGKNAQLATVVPPSKRKNVIEDDEEEEEQPDGEEEEEGDDDEAEGEEEQEEDAPEPTAATPTATSDGEELDYDSSDKKKPIRKTAEERACCSCDLVPKKALETMSVFRCGEVYCCLDCMAKGAAPTKCPTCNKSTLSPAFAKKRAATPAPPPPEKKARAEPKAAVTPRASAHVAPSSVGVEMDVYQEMDSVLATIGYKPVCCRICFPAEVALKGGEKVYASFTDLFYHLGAEHGLKMITKEQIEAVYKRFAKNPLIRV